MRASPSTPPRLGRDTGFTLIEVSVSVALAGVLMAIAVTGWQGWRAASAQEGLGRTLRSELRTAQQRAVTEGTSTCVEFDAAAETWSSYRGACDSTARTLVDGPHSADGLDLASPRFTSAVGTTRAGVTFSPRGTATAGSVAVLRAGSTHVVTVSVEGLTGRVSVR